jgi:hypothetical protein
LPQGVLDIWQGRAVAQGLPLLVSGFGWRNEHIASRPMASLARLTYRFLMSD